MKAMMAVLWVVVLTATGCSDQPDQQASIPSAASPASSPSPASNAPVWEIGEDIAGKTVMIDGKETLIPADVADSKRKMDAAAKEALDAMDELEKRRLQRFNDPDMTP
ncbi:MAG TPA: hypothetical protein PLQ74_08020 [Pseudomonadota bacterium]|nr:hypothetical protein [Rhodanobacteraceae bacterium]MBP9153948.1 hypothetical protein [Xanthomonadales bacterium]HQW81798.1 hypothetical protein [Pseudomonadota bacterium]